MNNDRDLFVCPSCRGNLRSTNGQLICVNCARAYAEVDGITLLVAPSDGNSKVQAEFYDSSVDDEFEITRPHGQPALYSWLLEEKFRRCTSAIAGRLAGAKTLAVCAGSGMDAEFLVRAGANVVASDISLGAARRVQARARRFKLALPALVSDAQQLPFRDQSFDIVYVHDGLHHLDDPLAGIVEMARVARFAVCISEPATAMATEAAIRLGISDVIEEAGNRVARLSLSEVVDALASAGFRAVTAERYAMFYRHEPGVAARALSAKGLFPLARAFVRAGNLAIGRFGNKLAVTAVRQ